MSTDAPKAGDPLHATAPHAWVAFRHWLYRHGLKSTAKLVLPDFLGIGAQKAGTTWLHANLAAHPGIFMPPEAKEVHFFDRHILNYGLEGYSSLFRPGWGKIKGEITPSYSILAPQRIRFVRAVMPNVKLIFLMRNPIDRAWSHALMTLVTKPARPLEHVTDAEFLAHFQSPASLRRGNYPAIFDHWLAHFPRRQMFIGIFDDLRRRPRHLLTEIFAFLNVTVDVDFSKLPCDQPVFKGPDAPLSPHLRTVLLQMYEKDIRQLGEQFAAPAERWIKG